MDETILDLGSRLELTRERDDVDEGDTVVEGSVDVLVLGIGIGGGSIEVDIGTIGNESFIVGCFLTVKGFGKGNVPGIAGADTLLSLSDLSFSFWFSLSIFVKSLSLPSLLLKLVFDLECDIPPVGLSEIPVEPWIVVGQSHDGNGGLGRVRVSEEGPEAR